MNSAPTAPRTKPPTPAKRPVRLESISDLASEAAFLACCILDGACLSDYAGRFAAADFADPRHQVIWRTLVKLHQAGVRDVDGVQLRADLSCSGSLEAAGGLEYLQQVVDTLPSGANVRYYANIVWDRLLRRSLLASAHACISDINDGMDTPELLDSIEGRLTTLRERARFAGDAEVLAESAPDLAVRALSGICDAMDGKKPRLTETGFPLLDERLGGGFAGGELIIPGARPSVGKTALGLNVADHVARNQGSVAFVSLEMPPHDIMLRWISLHTGLSVHQLRRGDIKPDEFERVKGAANLAQTMPLRIVSVPTLSPLDVRAQVRRLHRKAPLRLIVVDYLQRLYSMNRRTENRNQELAAIVGLMKSLALECDTPLMLLSQLNRGLETRPDHRPRSSDLRDSGEIEQAADVVLLLHREDVYHMQDSKWQATNTMEIIISKQRNGPPGVHRLAFDPVCMGLTEKDRDL